MMALLAALGAGYLGSKEKDRTNKREDAADQRVQEEWDMKKAEYEQKKADRDAARSVGTETQSAAYTPEQGQQLDAMASAKDPQGNPYYAVGNDATGKYTVTPNFQDETGAQPKAYSPASIAADGVNYLGKAYDKPLSDAEATGARRTRMADLAAGGNAFAENALTNDQKTVKLDQEQQDRVKLLKKEGVFDASAALRRGDAAGMAEAFNRSGDYKIIGDVAITPEKRTIPNAGDVDTFTATFQMKGPDGKVQTVTRNSLDLSTQLMPYEKQLDEMSKRTKEASEADGRSALAEYHRSAADALKPGGAKNKGAGSTDMSDIDTRTLTDINKQREMIQSEIIKAQAAENFDPTKPGAKALTTQLAALALKAGQIQAKYSTVSAPDPLGMRSPSQPGSPTPTAGRSETVVSPQQQQSRDSDRAQILASEINSAQQRLAAGDTRAQGDIDALNRELGRVAVPAPAQAAPATPSVTNAAGVASGGVTTPVAAPLPVKTMSTLDQIQARNVAAMVPLAQQFKQANQMFLAAAKSGDQKAIAQYMQAKEALRAQLEKQANEKFGNGAPAVLQKLYAN